MKLNARQIDGFLAKPPAGIRAILVYGPDSGLVKQRSAELSKNLGIDWNDPFNSFILDHDAIASDIDVLNDALYGISLGGGRRYIRIHDASDKLTTPLKSFLEDTNNDTLVILAAGELGPRSSLRALCERAESAAALPCYVEAVAEVENFIRKTLMQAGMSIDPDALSLMASAVTGDRMLVEMQLNKLMIYMGHDKKITADDISEIIVTDGQATIDALCDAYGLGDKIACESLFKKLSGEGIPNITIIRSLLNHLRRLHQIRARVDMRENIDQVIKSLHPPVFFKREQVFKQQILKLNTTHILAGIEKLLLLEAQLKKTGMPEQLLVNRLLLGR